MIFVMAASLTALVLLGTNLLTKGNSVATATRYYNIAMASVASEAPDPDDIHLYSEAYDYLKGIKLNEEDTAMYNKLSVLASVSGKYDSYEVFHKNELETEALDALVCAAGRCELNVENATEFGCESELEALRIHIEQILSDEYDMSYDEAIEIDNDSNVGDNNDFDDNADNNSDNTAGDNSGNNSDNTAGDNSGSNNSSDTGGNSGDNSGNNGNNSNDTSENVPATHVHNYQIVITPAGYERRGCIEKVCSECGDVETLSEISAITSIKLQNEVYTYTGKTIKPKVVIKDETGAVLGKDNYTTAYSNNKSIGIAKVTITFKGNYSGTIDQSFTIAPKSVSITSVSALSKGFTVSWKKGKDITGYEIQYSVNRKFTTKTSKKVLVTGKNTQKKQIKKITGNKNYYVRIRTYKTVKGKKIYSNWSSAKSVKTKK